MKLYIFIIPFFSLFLSGCEGVEEKKRKEKLERVERANVKMLNQIEDERNMKKYCTGKENCTQEDANKMALDELIETLEKKK